MAMFVKSILARQQVSNHPKTNLGLIVSLCRQFCLLRESLLLDNRLVQLSVRVTQLALANEQLEALSKTCNISHHVISYVTTSRNINQLQSAQLRYGIFFNNKIINQE